MPNRCGLIPLKTLFCYPSSHHRADFVIRGKYFQITLAPVYELPQPSLSTHDQNRSQSADFAS